ncbi:MAG: hypothetical protein JJU06_21230 [Ectothiorhodospiraceae bacterium]|nr:hypothetical protein [Ectothiorhodospiraceae bacterium]MCH8505024.1 hypothetical protein [Ectothiorhodospiraceae bacterium]
MTSFLGWLGRSARYLAAEFFGQFLAITAFALAAIAWLLSSSFIVGLLVLVAAIVVGGPIYGRIEGKGKPSGRDR